MKMKKTKSREEVAELVEEQEEVVDVEEKYLHTANWQLGNRKVRCCLMSDIKQRSGGRGREKRGQTVEEHLHRMDH